MNWEPIETAPKCGGDVLLHDGDLCRMGFYDWARGGQWSKWPGREKMEPTHWMPLPPPPAMPTKDE